MNTKLITIEGVNLIVEYKFEGKHYPATHELSEEFPELYLLKVCVEDSNINIYELLSDWQIEVVYYKIWESNE